MGLPVQSFFFIAADHRVLVFLLLEMVFDTVGSKNNCRASAVPVGRPFLWGQFNGKMVLILPAAAYDLYGYLRVIWPDG